MNQFAQKLQSKVKPIYRDVYRGVGISASEYEVIKKVSLQLYQSKINYISKAFSDELKNHLGGEWFVFVNPEDNKYDFSITKARDIDYVSFIIENTLFVICRILTQ